MSLGRELNPVAYKDLLVFARTPGGGLGMRTVWVSVALSLPLLAFAWALTAVPGPWRFGPRPVFLAVAALMALFNFSVAVPAATAFALERDRETLEGLVVSPLSPWRLVLGKLVAALAIGLFTKSAMLPPLALAFALGGEDLSFVPAFLLLLLATDMSFASFALLVGARRLEAPSRVGWLRTQTSQSQLALQSSAALSVVASLIPVYAAIFLVPLAFQQGVRLESVLDALAPLGVLHPLAALVLWGPVDVFGVRFPLWLLAVVFHVLAALPMLADAAEAQRSEGNRPGRAPRLLALPALAFLLLLAGSASRSLPPGLGVLVCVALPVGLVLTVALRTAFVSGPSHPSISRHRLLEGFWPPFALESAPARAPGYVLLIALMAAALLVGGTRAAPAGLLSAVALVVTGVGLATVGARLVAWNQEKDDRAFLEAVRRQREPAAPKSGLDEGTIQAEEADRRARLRGRVIARALVLTVLLPLLAVGGLALSQGSLPALAGLRPLFQGVAAFGLAMNPIAAVLPVLVDPGLIGSDALARGFAGLGIDPWLVFGLSLAIYGLALVASLATMRRPLDLEQVLAERLAQSQRRLAAISPQELGEEPEGTESGSEGDLPVTEPVEAEAAAAGPPPAESESAEPKQG